MTTIAGHDENCDVFQLAPDGGPSQKPCNCRPLLGERPCSYPRTTPTTPRTAAISTATSKSIMGLVDDTDYGDGPGYPSPCLPRARDLARMLVPGVFSVRP